jgi:aspartyl-tRNA(Asn)/glutamyl-tRNA(Gln) amidotransferase subunit A
MPLCWTLDKLGPLARTAEDCGLILDAIAGPDPDDPTTISKRYGYGPGIDRSRPARIGVLVGATDGCEPAVAANFIAALDVLRDFATIEEVELPPLPYAEVTHIIIGSEGLSSFDELVEHGRIGELTAPRDRVGGYAYETILARDYLRAMRIRKHIVRAMDELCSRYDALVAPGTPQTAPPAFEPFPADSRRGGVPITAAGAAAGLPAVCVPSGFNEAGLPTSIQFVGRALEENRVIAAARMYQERTQWHQRMP